MTIAQKSKETRVGMKDGRMEMGLCVLLGGYTEQRLIPFPSFHPSYLPLFPYFFEQWCSFPYLFLVFFSSLLWFYV